MAMSKLILTLILGSTIVAGAQAQEFTGVLKKIQNTGTLTLGAPDTNVPFAYLNNKQEHIGYSMDLCMKIAAGLQKKLALPKLKVNVVSVTNATRIALIQNGSIDMGCDSATNNLKRQKQVSFAYTNFIATGRLMAKKASQIQSIDDVRGKTVVSTGGSSNMAELVQLNRDKKLGMNILSSKDHAEGFLMVATGRAVAFAMDDILVAGLIANSRSPNDYMISNQALAIGPSGFILRHDDPAFKKAVNETLSDIYTSGQINEIYAKWFMSPIPPKGINLNFPMTERLKAAFAHPTDSGNPDDYQ